MEFYERPTIYDVIGKKIEKNVDLFYARELARTVEAHQYPFGIEGQIIAAMASDFEGGEPGHFAASTNNGLIAEWNWIRCNRPYYKIWPQWIKLFSKTRLNVPSKFLVLPFKTILIRLPKTDNSLKVDETHHVKTICATMFHTDERIAGRSLVVSGEKRCLLIWADFGELDNLGLPVYSYIQLPFTDEGNVDEAIDALPRSRTADIGIKVSQELMVECLKLVVSVSFLATGADRLVQPDILSKDIDKFLETKDDQKKKDIINRAHRRGKVGWNIGTKEIVLGLHRDRSQYEETGKKRGSLHYQHIRGWHFRVLENKVVLVRQTTVRPDLPPPPDEKKRGYRTKNTLKDD